jgi:5-hydroxyisourate hydrolase
MSLSTHVLDSTRGRPAAKLRVRLERPDGSYVDGVTDDDGRIGDFGRLMVGVHRLTFATGDYFADIDTDCFHPEVVVTFDVLDPDQHHHVALLLSPFAYTTYRGS